MNQPTDARKKLLIIAGIFGAAVIVVILFAIFQPREPQAEGPTGEVTGYTDPYSGEAVTETEGKVPESFNTSGSMTFLGISRLLDYGISQQQITLLKAYLQEYSHRREANQETAFKEVTIDFNTYSQSISQESSQTILSFEIVANRDENQRYYIESHSTSTYELWTKILTKDKQTVLFDIEAEDTGDLYDHDH